MGCSWWWFRWVVAEARPAADLCQRPQRPGCHTVPEAPAPRLWLHSLAFSTTRTAAAAPQGWVEAPITFMPTFKFKVGTHTYLGDDGAAGGGGGPSGSTSTLSVSASAASMSQLQVQDGASSTGTGGGGEDEGAGMCACVWGGGGAQGPGGAQVCVMMMCGGEGEGTGRDECCCSGPFNGHWSSPSGTPSCRPTLPRSPATHPPPPRVPCSPALSPPFPHHHQLKHGSHKRRRAQSTRSRRSAPPRGATASCGAARAAVRATLRCTCWATPGASWRSATTSR